MCHRGLKRNPARLDLTRPTRPMARNASSSSYMGPVHTRQSRRLLPIEKFQQRTAVENRCRRVPSGSNGSARQRIRQSAYLRPRPREIAPAMGDIFALAHPHPHAIQGAQARYGIAHFAAVATSGTVISPRFLAPGCVARQSQPTVPSVPVGHLQASIQHGTRSGGLW